MAMVKLINKFGMVSFVEESRKMEHLENFGYKDPDAEEAEEKKTVEKKTAEKK